MTAVLTRPMTAEEFAALPEDDRGGKYELLEGELLYMVAPGAPHAKAVSRLAVRLGLYVEDHDLGQTYSEMGFLLGHHPDSVLVPDWAFVGRERLHEEALCNPYWPGPPDIAIEVVSPNDRPKEVAAKVVKYLTAGARLVWVINPQTRQVAVHTLSGTSLLTSEDVLEGGAAVPGWTLPVARLFD